jgi:thioredoxin 1
MTSTRYKITVIAVVATVIAAGAVWKTSQPGGRQANRGTQLPAVLDFGMGKCVACKKMKPILDELAEEYAGRARIEIIDIGEHPDQADKYEVRLVPTQVFFDAEGHEVFRHEGFMPKADIVAQLGAMGVD